MNFDRDQANTDEYLVAALQIFECCGVESSGTLCVDSLMDKLAPSVNTNKAELSYLKTLLDPKQSNPDFNVTKLAKALHKYSESQKTKVDLDESFNLKNGQVAQYSDSGISTDVSMTGSGLQLLEELQCELKVREHLANQLREQLDYSDRQHEETLATLTCERDLLKTQLNVVREENATLCHLRKDHDEVCERLCVSETALGDLKREIDTLRKKARVCEDHVAQLETDKMTLQELLSKSKDECHRINEMYASRQSTLLEENETMKTEHAELTARLLDQDHFMQQIIKEKVHLEMELKDLLNKSNQSPLRFDRSIDVSYTDDQILTALDSLNADSRFSSENRILDEESFLSALKEDQGRPTNISLFDEIRLSFCNVSRITLSDVNDINVDRSLSNHLIANVGTQTDEDANGKEVDTDRRKVGSDVSDDTFENIDVLDKIIVDVAIQTDKEEMKTEIHDSETQTDCNETIAKGVQTLGVILRPRPFAKQRKGLVTTTNVLRQAIETQTEDCPIKINPKDTKTVETQTEVVQICNINNNGQDTKCMECESARMHKDKLETSLKCTNQVISEVKHEIDQYEKNLQCLQKIIDEGKDKNMYLQAIVDDLATKIEILQAVTEKQGDVIGNLLEPDVCCVDCQTEFDQTSVATQVEVPCAECDKRNAIQPHRSLTRFFWDTLKCLFQLFAVVCFLCAICVLCGVAPGRGMRGECRAAPWRWLQLQDVMDLLFRIEYTAEVPM